MTVYQLWNSKLKSYVKYDFSKDGLQSPEVKRYKPFIPFKGVLIKRRKK